MHCVAMEYEGVALCISDRMAKISRRIKFSGATYGSSNDHLCPVKQYQVAEQVLHLLILATLHVLDDHQRNQTCQKLQVIFSVDFSDFNLSIS